MTKQDFILQLYTAAVEILNQTEHEAEIYENYSGRAMFGKTTTGIVTDAPCVELGWAITVAFTEIEENGHELIDDARDYLPTRSDNMGLSMIYY